MSFFSKMPGPTIGFTQPANQWVRGNLSSGVQQTGREPDHSPVSSLKLRIRGAMPQLLMRGAQLTTE